MQSHFHSRTLQRRLLMLAAGGTIITAVIVALAIAIPFYKHNKDQRELYLKATTTNRALTINEYLDMLGYISVQVTSRTVAREQLEQYDNGDLTLAELRRQTIPDLEDAMALTPEMIGLTRLDRDGRPVIEIGRSAPAEHWPTLPASSPRRHAISPPVQFGDQRALVVSAAIYDRAREQVGTDVITFAADTLFRLLNDQQGLTRGETPYLGILHDNELLTIPAVTGDGSRAANELTAQLQSALRQGVRGQSGVITGGGWNDRHNIIAYTPISNMPPWGLAINVTADRLYAPLREQALLIVAIVAVLALIAIALMINLLRPLTGRILVHTDELERQVYKNTLDLQRSNRALSAISACSNALVHAHNEKQLLHDICSIIVSVGGYRMTWIGYAQEDKSRTVLPMAQAGFEEGYLQTVRITWSEDDPLGRGPGGVSIRSGAPCIIRDVLNDARFEPWRDEATKRGFASVIGLPLTYEEHTFGALLIYAAERDAFDTEEVRLMSELADDLAYGIMMLRTRDERQWTEQELLDSEERWRSLTENSPDHILTLTPALRIEFANYAAPGLNVEALIGTAILDYIDDAAKRQEVKTKLETTLADGTPCSYETEYVTPSGETLYYESRAAPRFVGGVIAGLTLNTRDITQRKRDEARIQHLAYHDELTGLPNRRLLMDRLGHTLSIARRHRTKGALLFLDLDRFKNINDSLGHAVGDAILCEVARRLKENVRAEDSVARLGGDEFMVLLPELKNDEKEASYEASVVADKLRHSLSQSYVMGDHQYHITPSIGIVIFPFADETGEDILKHADTAMYRAKAAGRDEVRFYRPSMQEAVDRRLALEKDLRSALNSEALQLYYQPLMSIDNRVVGAEALLRWQHPQHGWISPKDFIPVAEETGMILPLGDWVMHLAITQLRQWQAHRWAQQPGFMAINISARQFHQADFVSRITRALNQHDVQPGCLKLELTESLVIEDIVDTVAKMEALRELGVHIAIDDFGTGYSSLAYLKRLPIDQIKIDKSFVLDLTRDSNDAAIVETIISVARHLSLGVVAEGVETPEVLQALKQNHCHIFQGYYFAQALPPQEFAAFVARSRHPEPA